MHSPIEAGIMSWLRAAACDRTDNDSTRYYVCFLPHPIHITCTMVQYRYYCSAKVHEAPRGRGDEEGKRKDSHTECMQKIATPPGSPWLDHGRSRWAREGLHAATTCFASALRFDQFGLT